MSETKKQGRPAKPKAADITEPKQYHMASCSFGKDSLAMILMLIEKEYPLDEAVFFDTGMEFEAIYNTRDKMLPIFKAHGIKYMELSPKMPFEYKMFEKPVCKRGTNIVHKKGYGWCGGTCRWGTTEKLQALDGYCISKNAICYIGIANDETERLEKEKPNWKLHPLADWEMDEKDCLQLCYDNGWNWREDTESGHIHLYDILDRVSCWCSRNKNLKELKGIYYHLPKYWNKLKLIQSKLDSPMKHGTKTNPNAGNVFELEKRFEREVRDGRR